MVWDTEHPCFWPNKDPLQALTMANVTPAILRMMTKGAWRFDGKGYLASRIATDQTVAEWRTEATVRLKQLWKRAKL